MPIYEYLCNDCGERYEQIVMSKSQTIACPKCASKKHTLQLSVFAARANGNKSSAGSSASSPASCGCTPDSCGCH
jgi:putative FmdB family regulatory protein